MEHRCCVPPPYAGVVAMDGRQFPTEYMETGAAGTSGPSAGCVKRAQRANTSRFGERRPPRRSSFGNPLAVP